jgi:3-oxoacyl-(acyl-carrier-protein) synthase
VVFDRLYAGESAIRRVRSGTPEFGNDALLAPVEFDPGELIARAQRMFMDRAAQLAVVAAHHALVSGGLLADGRGPAQAGVYIGC